MIDAMEARARARYEAETDPVQREAYALAKRAGFDWYNTESSARRMAEHAAEEISALRSALDAVQMQTGDWSKDEIRRMGMETALQMVDEALSKLAR